MDKAKVRKVWPVFKSHVWVAFKGIYRVLCGTLISSLAATSVIGFTIVPVENGWAAVADFILSAGLMALSGICIYGMGKDGKNA